MLSRWRGVYRMWTTCADQSFSTRENYSNNLFHQVVYTSKSKPGIYAETRTNSIGFCWNDDNNIKKQTQKKHHYYYLQYTVVYSSTQTSYNSASMNTSV